MLTSSSVKAEYRAMVHTACKMMGLSTLIWELGFSEDGLSTMHYVNQVAAYVTSNPIFHERTKHIEVDCHFIHNVAM